MKIGLALSGGGVLGASHIGVLEQLEANKIKIDTISGTSAGAIVGLLYAAGGIKAIDHFLLDMEKAGLLSRTRLLLKRNETIFSTIEELLRKNTGAYHFYDLKIKFYCSAVDIVTGELLVIDNGDPVAAVMASAAYPGVFPVQNFKEHHCIDGGIMSNFPVNALKKDGCDYIIGSSLYSLARLEKFTDIGKPKIHSVSVAVRAIDIMSKVIAENEAKNCDFCFYPPVEEFNWFNFDQVFELRKVGEEYAEKEVKNLMKSLEILSTIKQIKKKSFWDVFR